MQEGTHRQLIKVKVKKTVSLDRDKLLSKQRAKRNETPPALCFYQHNEETLSRLDVLKVNRGLKPKRGLVYFANN